MKLHYWHRNSLIGATKSSHLVTASQKLHSEEFVSKLLDRRWTLETPESKVHQIMFQPKQTQANDGMFGNINFSIDKCPALGDAAVGESCKDSSFYIVRDDLLHPLVNGNKPRKLDALLPIIEDCSGTDVVTCGGCQSAHTAAVAVSCAERGLRSHLLLRGEEPEILTGYNLISSLYGNVVYVPRSLYAKREEMLASHASIVAGPSGSVLWFTDILDSLACAQSANVTRDPNNGARKVVIVNEGAGDVVALLGIFRLVHYLSRNHVLGNDRPYNFVIDAGTGTTAVGFALGAQMLGLPWKVTSVMLADTVDGYKAQEQHLIADFRRYYTSDVINSSLEIENGLVEWVDRGSPRRFGKVLDGEINACQQVANQTGVLVDPIYTLAAWELASQLSQKREGKEGPRVVMLHTGGTLGMFGLAQRFKPYFSKLKDSNLSGTL